MIFRAMPFFTTKTKLQVSATMLQIGSIHKCNAHGFAHRPCIPCSHCLGERMQLGSSVWVYSLKRPKQTELFDLTVSNQFGNTYSTACNSQIKKFCLDPFETFKRVQQN